MGANAEIPKHWQELEAAIISRLLVGDILYGYFDDLTWEGVSTRRLLVARPSEEKMFLISASMSPGDEQPSEPTEFEIMIDAGEQVVGTRWKTRDARIALRAAEDAVDGSINQRWLTVWGERKLHIIAVVSRSGMRESFCGISASRPIGSFFKKTSQAWTVNRRTLLKLFNTDGHATVFGGTHEQRSVRLN